MHYGRGLVSAFLALYVVGIGVPLARAVPIDARTDHSIAPSIVTSKIESAAAKAPLTKQTITNQTPSSSTNLKVEMGIDPGTLRIEFPAGTKQTFAVAAVGPLGLTFISGDASSGHYVFALPKISVYIDRADPGSNASDRAWIGFPRIYSDEDISSYLDKNRLKIDRWTHDPETGDRFAVVVLARREAPLTPAERGGFSITQIPTH